jgi:hypothetical protein
VRLALLSDQHANDVAFGAALADEIPTDSPEGVTERRLEVKEWTPSRLSASQVGEIRAFDWPAQWA